MREISHSIVTFVTTSLLKKVIYKISVMKEFKLIAIQMCCSYSYAIKVNMNKYVASVHEGKKPYECDFCDHSCSTKGTMKRHVAVVHRVKKHFQI